MAPSRVEFFGTLFFALAVLHTFFAARILSFSHRFRAGTIGERLFYFLGEIEVVFAIWASVLMLFYVLSDGWSAAIHYQDSLNFIEPVFIFVIMVVCSTSPILAFARGAIQTCSAVLQKILKTPAVLTDFFVVLTVGPLSGSLITEPAAMTVTAFLLVAMLTEDTGNFLYPLLAVLFVNVSIGGALTPFAAPPILMVAHTWQWDFSYVFMHFGWKSASAVVINAIGFVFLFSKQLRTKAKPLAKASGGIPRMVISLYLACLILIVVTSHHQNAFLSIFFVFLALVFLAPVAGEKLRLKESLLVAIFLGGIIVFGTFQKWWLAPLLTQMTDHLLFGGAVVLTAFTDNAALTYLGAQVPSLTEASRYALVAGAISGGGLTLIANAPNAAGFSILSKHFPQGLAPLKLAIAAVPPTLVACLFLFFK